MQASKGLQEYLDDTLVNKMIESRVPESCKQKPCILGIDEAGRGPVLGPMVYAIAYYPQSEEEILRQLPYADSKKLTENTRELLFEHIQTKGGGYQDIGYAIKIVAPNMISNSMLRRKKYNLNALSHNTAVDLINSVKSKKIKIAHVYIDTVGPADKYKAFLKGIYPTIEFTVAEKADSKYPIVSAASVCAKVMRDRIVQNWRYVEGKKLRLEAFKLGSGYPADPDTKKFITDSIDPVFGYPTLARFSWSTVTKAMDNNACKCDWNDNSDDDTIDPIQLKRQQDLFRRSFIHKKAGANSETKVKPLTAHGAKAFKNNHPSSKPVTTADKFFADRQLSRVFELDLS